MRFIKTQIAKPYNSVRRRPEPGYIAEFTFDGEPEPGNSPPWSATSNVLLTAGYVNASTTGDEDLVLSIMSRAYLAPEPRVLLEEIILPANKYKTVFSFDNTIDPKLATPYDDLFVTVWTASGHEQVVVKLIGEIL